MTGALWAALAAVNALGFFSVWQDKRRARRGAWRTPEKRFFLLAALGGCPGVYLAMRLLRHKTRHRRFMWGLPALLAVQCVGTAAICRFLS